MSGNFWKVRGGGVSTSGAFTVNGSGWGDSSNAAFVPKLLARTVVRTTTVPAGDESIYLQEEMAWPHSAPATTFIVGGADAAWFEPGPTGSIVFKAATRASMTRRDYALMITPVLSGVGTGVAQPLTVRFPASSANEFFVSYGSGSESNDGSTPALARKFLPGTVDATGGSKTFAHGDCVFMKGEIHRTAHIAHLTQIYTRLAHAGQTGDPVWIEWSGWGTTRGVLDGSDIITGASSVTQAEVGGNTNYLNIKKWDLTSQGGALEWFQGVYDGPSKLFRAQFPTPANLYLSDLPDNVHGVGSEQFGFRNIPCATSGASYMGTDGASPDLAGTIITIKDPIFASRYGNVAVTKLPKIMVLTPNNNTAELVPSSYDFSTSTVTITGSVNLGTRSGKASFAILFSALDIVQAGQYAMSSDGLTLYAWLPNNSTVSVSRRGRAVDWGMGGYVKYSGGSIRRFCAGDQRSGGNTNNAGVAFEYYKAGYIYECDIINMWMGQCHSDDGALIYGAVGGSGGANTAGVRNSNIELCLFTENECSGLRFTCTWDGPVSGGSFAAVDASTTGKIQANSFPAYSINRTAMLLQGGEGFQVRWNSFSVGTTLHGNAVSLYHSSGGAQLNHHSAVNQNDAVNMSRFLTTDDNSAFANIYFKDNLVLNADDSATGQSPSVACYNGWIGGEFSRNLIMNYAPTTFYLAVNFSAGSQTLDLHNNVIAGLGLTTGWTGSVNDNLFTCELQVADNIGNGGTHTGNQNYTGGAQVFQFTSITSDMQSKLGSGPVGCFRSVA